VSNSCTQGNDLFKTDSVVSSGGKVPPVVVTEGHCLAANNLHRGVAQAVILWAVTTVFPVLTGLVHMEFVEDEVAPEQVILRA
jgi:hypothetical protein